MLESLFGELASEHFMEGGPSQQKGFVEARQTLSQPKIYVDRAGNRLNWL
jgi:hypothetical protein